MPPTRPGTPGLSKRQFNAIANRFQGAEKIQDITFATLTRSTLNRPFPLSRPLEGIELVWRGRVVIGTADYTAVAAEAPQTIVERIRLFGTHRFFGQQILIDISGAMAFTWLRCFQIRGNDLFIGTTRQADPTSPFAQVGATFGNQATYDLEIHYIVPLSPVFGPSARPSLLPFLLMPEDWQDTLTFEVTFGDKTSFGTPAGGTTVTITAFGSGAGSPVLGVYANYALLGGLAGKIRGAVILRQEQTVSGVVSAIASGIQLLNLQKNRTSNIVVKSGILLTGTSGGVTVFASLADTILGRTQVLADNKPIRNITDNWAASSHHDRHFNTIAPQGYLPISFCESMNPGTMLRGDLIPGGSSFLLQTDILTANANNAIRVVQEMVLVPARA